MRCVDPRYPLSELTRDVIAAFYRTYHALRFGFLEPVYQRALTVELQHAGRAVPVSGVSAMSAASAATHFPTIPEFGEEPRIGMRRHRSAGVTIHTSQFWHEDRCAPALIISLTLH